VRACEVKLFLCESEEKSAAGSTFSIDFKANESLVSEMCCEPESEGLEVISRQSEREACEPESEGLEVISR
jgi:hypothetical protein